MALTAIEVKGAKATDKPQKLSDGGGLFLLVQPNGAKYWRLAYRFAGKQKTLALGVYPDVPLLEARTRREAARKLLANGADPSDIKKSQKAAVVALTENSDYVAYQCFNLAGKFDIILFPNEVQSLGNAHNLNHPESREVS